MKAVNRKGQEKAYTVHPKVFFGENYKSLVEWMKMCVKTKSFNALILEGNELKWGWVEKDSKQ